MTLRIKYHGGKRTLSLPSGGLDSIEIDNQKLLIDDIMKKRRE
jgi:hypothetical protein